MPIPVRRESAHTRHSVTSHPVYPPTNAGGSPSIRSMYESHFAFLRRPFRPIADVSSYIPNATFAQSLQSVQQCMECGTGVAVVIGESGIGKTLFLRLIAQQTSQTVLLANGPLRTPKSLFQQILFGFCQPLCSSDEEELRLQLLDYVQRQCTLPNNFPYITLLVDDGQTLTYPVLEELRQLTDMDDGDSPLFRLTIAGTPQFEENLLAPQGEWMNTKIVLRSYLEPLSRGDLTHYIGEQTGSATLFSADAIRTIHQLTGGVSRTVNQLCDHSLLLAASRGESVVDEPLIQQAWAKLQQFPVSDVSPTMTTPMLGIAPCPTAARNTTFGVLPDESDTMDLTAAAAIISYTQKTEADNEEEYEKCADENTAEEDTEWCSFELDEKSELAEELEQVEESEWDEELEQEERESDVRERTDHVYLTCSPRVVSDVGLPTYPGYPGNGSTMLNWVSPGHQVPSGVATPYRWTYTPAETTGHFDGVSSTFPAAMKTPIPPQVELVVASSLGEVYDEVVHVSSDAAPARYVAENLAIPVVSADTTGDTPPLPSAVKNEHTAEDLLTETDWFVKLSDFHKEIKGEIKDEIKLAVAVIPQPVRSAASTATPLRQGAPLFMNRNAGVSPTLSVFSSVGGRDVRISKGLEVLQGVNLIAALQEPVKKEKVKVKDTANDKETGRTTQPVVGISLEQILSESFASF